jgi:hypothetical protein
MEKEKLFTVEYIHLGRQMSDLSIQTRLDSFFKPELLRSETSTTSEASIDE